MPCWATKLDDSRMPSSSLATVSAGPFPMPPDVAIVSFQVMEPFVSAGGGSSGRSARRSVVV